MENMIIKFEVDVVTCAYIVRCNVTCFALFLLSIIIPGVWIHHQFHFWSVYILQSMG